MFDVNSSLPSHCRSARSHPAPRFGCLGCPGIGSSGGKKRIIPRPIASRKGRREREKKEGSRKESDKKKARTNTRKAKHKTNLLVSLAARLERGPRIPQDISRSSSTIRLEACEQASLSLPVHRGPGGSLGSASTVVAAEFVITSSIAPAVVFLPAGIGTAETSAAEWPRHLLLILQLVAATNPNEAPFQLPAPLGAQQC